MSALGLLAVLLATQRLAVLEPRSKLPQAEQAGLDASYFADQIRAIAKRRAPGLSVMTRENLLVLLDSTGARLDECEGACEVDTGRRVGADLVISGELLRVGEHLKLSLRMHETRGGQLVAGATASGRTAEELDASAESAVRDLLEPLREVAGAEAPARAPQPAARKAALTLLATGAVLASGAGLFAWLGKRESDRISQGGLASASSISDAAQRGAHDNLAAYACAAGAGLALAAGAVLLFRNPPTESAAVGAGPAGVSVSGKF